MNNLIFLLMLIIIIGCNDSKPEEAVSVKSNLDSVHKPLSQTDFQKDNDSSSCNPTILTASSTLKNFFVFQVKNFIATDKSCWDALKNHGKGFCQEKFPCRVLYIENETLGPYKKDPFYPDFDILKKYGIGEFTKFNDGGWQLAGSDAMSWERNKPGFDYLTNE